MNVYKKHLDVTHLQEIKLPITKIENDIVRVGVSDGKPCLWFLNKPCKAKNVVIHSYMTGEEIPEDNKLRDLGGYNLDMNTLIHLFAENL